MEEEINYFYSNFKKIRKDKNISINDISNQTKIQEKYIIAIEEGNLNILPSVYTRLFLKSYSEAINLDSERIIIEYENHISGKIKKVNINKTPKFIEDSCYNTKLSNGRQGAMINNIQGFLFDLDGVLCIDNKPINGAIELINILDEQGNK